MKPIVLGAVAYDQKVIPIWDGFRAYFAARDLAFDYVLYTSYERQVDAHLAGQLDVAWNSPLAWIDLASKTGDARAIAMRDSDRDLTSVIVVRAESPVRALADLRGKRVAVGAADSPQATLIPLEALADAGIDPTAPPSGGATGRGHAPGGDVTPVYHDVLLGKHGDHIGGERDAVKALLAGTVDAACVIDGNHLAFAREGLYASGTLRVVHHTGAYDHCNMSIIGEPTPALARFRELLLAMSYDDPLVRPLLDLEGLKVWLAGRTTGYALLERAVARFGNPGRR